VSWSARSTGSVADPRAVLDVTSYKPTTCFLGRYGPTELAKLLLLCSRHHALVDAQAFQLHVSTDRRLLGGRSAPPHRRPRSTETASTSATPSPYSCGRRRESPWRSSQAVRHSNGGASWAARHRIPDDAGLRIDLEHGVPADGFSGGDTPTKRGPRVEDDSRLAHLGSVAEDHGEAGIRHGLVSRGATGHLGVHDGSPHACAQRVAGCGDQRVSGVHHLDQGDGDRLTGGTRRRQGVTDRCRQGRRVGLWRLTCPRS